MKKYLFLSLLILFGGFLRFWNLSGLLTFTLDEELEAFIVKNIITGFHYPAIGVSVAPVGISLSPVFYYLVAIPFWLGNLNPIAWGIFASLIGVLTLIVFYLTTKVMFSQKVAEYSSIIYGFSFLIVMYDKHFWNVMFIPLISIIIIYSLYQLTKNKNYIWYIPLALFLSLGISSHLSSLSLVLLTIFGLIYHRVSIKNKYALISGGIIFLSQIPLVIFELRHKFYQTKILIKFFTGTHSGVVPSRILDNLLLLPKIFSRVLYTFGPHDYAREHTYGLVEIAARDQRIPVLMLLITILLIAGFLYLGIKRIKSTEYFLQISLLVITLLSLVFYGILFTGNLFEFYLLVLVPTLCLIIGVLADSLSDFLPNGRKIIALVLGVFVVLNSYATLTATHSYGLDQKLKLINWVSENLPNKPYELHSIGVDHKYEGYRYLFERFYRSPVKSYVDPQLSWLYDVPVSTKSADVMVVITSTEPDYQQRIQSEENIYRPGAVLENQFGQINVMVVATPSLSSLSSIVSQ